MEHEHSNPKENGMHHLMDTLLVAAMFIAALGGAPTFSGESGSAASPPPQEVGVFVITPRSVDIPFELNARATPFLVAEVRPQVNGIIQKRLFQEGGFVKANVPLYQIDPSLYQAQLNSAAANQTKAEATAKVAKLKRDRYEQLVKTKAISQEDYDEVEAAWEEAEADVNVAKASVDMSKINLDYTHVLSPIDGIIGKSSVTEGALVTASQSDALARVQQLDPIYVDATQTLAERLRLRKQIAAGLLEGVPDDQLEPELILVEENTLYHGQGKALFFETTVDQTTGSVNLRTQFPNPDALLLPGMYLKVKVVMARKKDAILVPQQALQRDPAGKAYVVVVKDTGEAERRPVETMRAIGNEWLLSSGLSAGEQVVVQGFQYIRFVPGMPAPKVKAKVMTYADLGLDDPAGAKPEATPAAPAK